MGRKLRVLLIDDNPVTELETEHLELVPVPYRGEDDPSLGSWAQHLKLWSDNLFPQANPDLLLVDCRFDADNAYVPMSEELKRQDPRGLLHGAIAVARMFGKSEYHPFGFAVYSMDAASFQDDAYAQTFMGFLLAMRDSSLPDGETGAVRGRRARDLVQVCSEELGRTVRQNPSTAWTPALRMYRDRFKEVADLNALVIDKDSWQKARDCVEREDWSAFDQGLSLEWRRSDGLNEEVEFRSLFADLLDKDKWTSEAGAAARDWLDSLLVLGDYLESALEWVHEVVENLKTPKEVPVPTGRDIRGGTLTSFFHGCAVVVAWLENREFDELQVSSGRIARSIGLNDKQVERFFRPAVNRSWGEVVDDLDDGLVLGVWPHPSLWEIRQVLHDWCVNLKGRDFPFRDVRRSSASR